MLSPDATGPTAALQHAFGYSSFRPGQEAVVNAVLAGRDVLAVMPTGSGKSLGYQLPALLLSGVTLVVSPLIALMKDQVDELNRRGIPAAAVHSLVSPADRRRAIEDAIAGRLRLLYVAPERFASEAFTRTLAEMRIARFAVDEAHCVSEWGHDFRPDYRRLVDAAARCRRGDAATGRPPIIAFTATATPEVRDDIVGLLGLRAPEVFVAGFDRPNLFMDVRRVSGPNEKLALLPGLVGHRRGLVYAATRKNTEIAAETLRGAGLRAAAYHAGLEEAERSRVQDGFVDGSLQVVCATNAFGMGIDRPDLEVVIHLEIPQSLEAYYQEMGRAGRDGRPAEVTLLWNYADVRTREFLISRDRQAPSFDAAEGLSFDASHESDEEERSRRLELDRKKLRRVVAYADSTACYRATLLGYFGERSVPQRCDHCGHCRRRRPLSDEHLLAIRKILSGIARAGERFGRRRIVSMLIGDDDDLPEALRALSTTGLMREEGRSSVSTLLDAAVGSGLVAESGDQYRTLGLTELGREVMAGRATEVWASFPDERSSTASAKRSGRKRSRDGEGARSRVKGSRANSEADGEPDERLLEALKVWRRQQAAERGVPAYVILHDRTLERLAAQRPATLAALSAIPGVGPVTLESYGARLVRVIDAGSRGRGSTPES